MNLRPYQEAGVDWLAGRKRALLADEMRLGKSAQAIRAAAKIGATRIGVICPASVVAVWHQQFERWWPASITVANGTTWTGMPDIKVCSYEKAVRGELDGYQFDVLVLDEAHYLKTKTSQRTKKVFGVKCDGLGGLIERADYVFALTGTPSPNHPAELWPMLRALAPETIARIGYWGFVNKFCKTTDNGFGIQIVGGKNLAPLRKAIEPFVLRRRYADVAADMPPLQIETLPVSGVIPDEGELKTILAKCGSDGDILAALQRNAAHVATLRRLTGLAKVGGIVDWFRNWRDADGGKVVFFAHHRDVIGALKTGLEGVTGAGRCCLVEGSMPQHVRALNIKHFNEKPECMAFVGQLQAAGTGIDLSAADTAVFVEMSWVPGENAQAAMRIQKVGKQAMNQVWLATFAGSIDEKISAANMRKMRDSVELFG